MKTPGHVPAMRGPAFPQPEASGRASLARYGLVWLVLIVCWDVASRLDDARTDLGSSPGGFTTAGLVAGGRGAVTVEAVR